MNAAPELRDKITRSIRSFALRKGRLTPAQRDALDTLLPRYQAQTSGKFCLEHENGFSKAAPVWLEIGFGNGEMLAGLAEQMPDVNFIGAEVYPPGVGRLLQTLNRNEISNVRVVMDDAVRFLQDCVADGALQRILLMFPDPWPKKRHHKRRIVSAEFADLVAIKLSASGVFHAASDWQPYIEHMLEVLEANAKLENVCGAGSCVQPPDYRSTTHFEKRGRALGHGVWDLMYRKSL